MPGSDARKKASTRQRELVKKLLAAGKVHFDDHALLTVLGANRAWSEVRVLLQQMLQPHLDYQAGQQRARAELGWLRAAVNAQVQGNGRWLAAIGAAIRGRFGDGHPLLREFGLGKGRRRKPSAATQAAAAEKRRKTRAAGRASRRRRR